MKRTVFVALIALFTMGFTLHAQDSTDGKWHKNQKGRTGMRWTAKDRAENMSKQLELSAEEKAKVEALFEQQDAKRAEQIAEHRAKREKVKQDRTKHREEMQAKRAKAVAENDTELEKIIGKEKMEKWKQYRSERQKEMRNSHRKGRRGAV